MIGNSFSINVKQAAWDIPTPLRVVAFASCLALSIGTADAETLTLSPDQDGVQRATIIMESYSFSPDHLIVQAGAPLELTLENESFLVPHNFVLEVPSIEPAINRTVSAGETAVVQLPALPPGQYAFYCDKQLLFFPNHREEGMEGRLDVR